MKYRVYIDANAHHMDTTQRQVHGEYDSAGAAVAAAREVVRAQLLEAHHPGMKTEELLARFAQRGEVPFIMPQDADTELDVGACAREFAQQICWRDEVR